MNPMLPGALIEREVICDLCSVPTTTAQRVELNGQDLQICVCCAFDQIDRIFEAANADMAGADASERDQED